MNNNWEKVESIFHSALALPFAERMPFLQRECNGDEAMRSEIESLINSFEKDSEFLKDDVFELGLGALGQKPEKNLAGKTIGVYEIEEKIGKGGMGEVYKAFDTQLNRHVALKFLSESLENDNAARRQLVKEAQAAAALEHPNICAVYGIEQTAEHHFIVMQYVEGITLSEKIVGEESIGAEEFKTLAKQILSAVAFAHSHGVIHRDLKPGNIMLTNDGQIKVLDFGLAKVISSKQLIGKRNNTDTSIFSKKGLIIGTVSYMSPEQLRGEKLDFQSDIFSVGIILYELLARQNPFHRPSQAETIAAILSETPQSLKEFAVDFPTHFFSLIEKCLHKKNENRFQSVAEILLELDITASKKPAKSFLTLERIWLKAAFAVSVLLVVMVAAYFYNAQNKKKTLAILPVSIDNSLPNKEYLAEGLTHNISDELSDLSELKIKNQSIVSRYKEKTDDAQNVGKELGVDAVWVGKLKSGTNGLVLETKLIRTTDGYQIDKFDYDIVETKLIELQENISNRIINKARLNLSNEDKTKLAKRDTMSEQAENLYLQGRFLLKRREGNDISNAINYFFEAKEIDQNFAKAWAGLADAYLSQASPGVNDSKKPKQAFESARLAANKALELDSTLAESYSSLGQINLRYEWNWKEAEGYFRMAIVRDPEFLPARLGLIRVLGYLKRNYEALEEARKIKEFDPLSVNSDIQIAMVYYRMDDYQQTEDILSSLLERFPKDRNVKYSLAYLFLKTNRPQKAVEIIEPFYNSSNDADRVYAAAPLGLGYAKLGRHTDALKIIKDLQEIGKRIYVPAQEEALIYVGLGDYDKVFENLRKSCSERFSSLPNWLTDPIVEEIKTDDRFNEIRQCVNL